MVEKRNPNELADLAQPSRQLDVGPGRGRVARAVGIAAGATLFGISGCLSCTGSYGAIPPPQQDAVANHEPRDAKPDGEHTDGGAASTTEGGPHGPG